MHNFGGILRQSTEHNLVLATFVDRLDGVTYETGLTGSTVRWSLNGSVFFDAPNTLGAHRENGAYSFLFGGELDAPGICNVRCDGNGAARMVDTMYIVRPIAVYDSLMAGSNLLQVNSTELTTTVVSVTSQTELVLPTSSSNIDDAYNGLVVRLGDASNQNRPSFHPILDYVGSSRLLTIRDAPNFTVVAGDTVNILRTHPYASDILRVGRQYDWESAQAGIAQDITVREDT